MLRTTANSPFASEETLRCVRRSLTQKVRPDVYMFGLPFWNASYDEMTNWWQDVLEHEGRTGVVVAFANAHTFTLAHNDPKFRDALAAADVLVNDGRGFRLASRLRGVKTRHNLNGTDLVPHLLRMAPHRVRVFLYGGVESSNEGAAKALENLSPDICVVGRCNGYVDPIDVALPTIRASKADVVLVALGHPHQELFCIEHREEMDCKVVFPIGGLVDFLSKRKPRAPKILRRMGLEWAYRLAIEPKRMFRRYIVGIPVFISLSFRYRKVDRLLKKNFTPGSNTWSCAQKSNL